MLHSMRGAIAGILIKSVRSLAVGSKDHESAPCEDREGFEDILRRGSDQSEED